MKGTYLGEFQELVLLSILILRDNAYGVTIKEEIGERTNRNISRGALHAALKRLEAKGFIDAEFGGASAVRGGRRKKYYRLTNAGQQAVENAREIRETMWKTIAGFAN